MKSRFALLASLFSLLSFVSLILLTHREPRNAEPSEINVEAFDRFNQWLTENSFGETIENSTNSNPATSREIDGASLAEGRELALVRKARLLELMKIDPAAALAQSISRSERDNLPDELKPLFEVPFNVRADLVVLPVCQSPDSVEPDRILRINGETWKAHSFGERNGHMTKENTLLHGITLDDESVVAEHSFEVLSPEDAEKLVNLPLINPDPTLDFVTGEPLGTKTVTAVAGGSRVLVANIASIDRLNHELAVLDRYPGPHTGAQVVFEMGYGDGAEGFNFGEATELATFQASTWTETPKSVFFIRVDFSDKPGEAVTQSTLANVINTAVSDSIEEMSYGKTEINATVSSSTIRMPNASTFYLPSDNSQLHDDAIAAYEAINGSGSLSSYDIIGVHFTSIGISNGGLIYGGLAGGSRQWLQNSVGSGLITHEFGHNYGLGHASWWQTSDGSVVGTGMNVEYGDPFDIMGGGLDPEEHFHMQGKSKLNWLESTQWVDVSTSGSGTYRLHRFDDDQTTETIRGARVTKATSPDEYYWVGYRPGISNNPWLAGGAYMIWQRPNFTRSWLMDTTPNSAGNETDSALVVGKTYSDTAANVHVTPTSTGGSGANSWIEVNIQLGAFPGNSNPTATLSGPGTVSARSSAAFSVVANDPNGDPLAYHWDFGDGGTAAANASAVNHSWTVGGTYQVSVTVSDMKGGTATDTLNVTVTDPLNTWTGGTIVSGRTMRDVAYLDGRFIAGGNRYLYYSPDGVSWEEIDLALNYRSEGFATDGNYFIAAGWDWDGSAWRGVIHRSKDGRIWEIVSPLGGTEFRDVAYGNGVFVAVGDNGRISRSTDSGENWTAAAAPGSANLDSVTYGNGIFMAVGERSVYTSPDGNTWTDRSSGTQLESWHELQTVYYNSGAFYSAGWYSDIQRSTDNGVTWSRIDVVGGSDYDLEEFAEGAGALVAVGLRKGSPDVPVLLISGDGLTWNESGVTSFPNTNSVTSGDGVFLTVYGSNGDLSQSNALFPTNQAPVASITAPGSGNARENITFTTSPTDPDTDPVIVLWDFNDGTPLKEGNSVSRAFSAGGSYTVKLTVTDTRGGVTTDTHNITISDSLNNWTSRTSGTTQNLYDIALGGGTLVAVGSGGTYRTSTNALTWTGGALGGNNHFRGIDWDGSKFVAVGYDYDFGVSSWKGKVNTSPDGVNWTQRYYDGEELIDIAFGGGRYVAVGDAGTLLTSADGVSWTISPTGLTQNLEGVSYGGGSFVVVGSLSNSTSGVVLTSTDGINWVNRTAGLGTGQGVFHVKYAGDRFLASGFYANLRHSTDGGVTFSTNLTEVYRTPGLAHGNSVYFAAGIIQDSGVDANLLSLDGETWTTLTTTSQPNRNGAIFFNNTFVTVGDNGNIWQSDTFSAPPQPPYSTWTETWFPGSPPLSGANQDFDYDGVKNLAEYATGTDPTSDADWPLMPVSVVGDKLRMTIPFNSAATDVTWTAQYSTDLNFWTSAGVSIISQTATEVTIEIDATISSSSGRGFIRVQFQLNP